MNLLTKKYKKYEKFSIPSIIHSIISISWLSYIFLFKLNFSYKTIFSHRLIENTGMFIYNNSELKDVFYSPGIHSISYFIADSFLKYKNYSYIIHHLMSIIMISSVFYGSPLSSAGLFYSQLGALFYHLKSFEKEYLNILYFLVYGFTRILMLLNGVNYLRVSTKAIDNFQVILLFPLLYQNFIWLWKNLKKYIKYV